MSKLLRLLATLSILVLPLPLVESQEDSRSSSASLSTSDGNTTLPTAFPTEIDPATFCPMVFDNIGPFCQFVIRNNGLCLEQFSDTTCDSCRDILNSCGTFDGDIHLSSLASSCPQSEEFLMDYCSVVDGTYMGSGGELSGSGVPGPVAGLSGSGSTSGDGGAGSAAGRLPGSGGSGEPQYPVGSGSGIGNDQNNGDTGPSPSTMPLLLPVSRASLTDQQRENIVTIGFMGINEQQFIERGLTVFCEEIADIVNINFGSNQLAKRQQPLFTPEDIFVIDSLNVVLIEADFVLLIEFVVGGQGQRSLVSSSDVVNLLMDEESRLATALSNAIGSKVEFYGFIGLELPTTLVLPSDFSAPNEALESQLSGNFVVGVVVGVSVASVMVVVTIMAIVIAICIIKKRKRKTATAAYVKVAADGENSFDTNWQPMTMNAIGDYTAVPATLWRKSEQESDNSASIL